MDTMQKALADGEALLRELEQKERDRENRRRNFKCVTVSDGRGGWMSVSIPRQQLER